jgi:putative transposase
VKEADKYLALQQTITDIFELNHRCHGYRRLHASLARQSVMVSDKVAQRLMKQQSLVIAKPKQRRYGFDLGEISPAPENLINRAPGRSPERKVAHGYHRAPDAGRVCY